MGSEYLSFEVQGSSPEVVLLNDSFPPLIDGVANTVLNYAGLLKKNGWDTSVVVPEYPGADDSSYPYPVIRYPSIDVRKLTGYTAGNPFSTTVQSELRRHNVSVIHSHCPFASNMVGRELRAGLDRPLILTYHSKFDVDITEMFKTEPMRRFAISALVESVTAADELWVVSEGAGRNIANLGYTGSYRVMPNGVDMPRRVSPEDEVLEATGSYDLPDGVPVLLFVGRMMWYKGLRIILDALAALRSRNFDFRMVFIGGGASLDEVRSYSDSLGLGKFCIFTGPQRDRKTLAAWYTRSDLFIFPSTYDTNGLVVREAAACGTGAVLIRGSCAAEGVTDGRNGLLTDENAASLAVTLATVIRDRSFMRQLGEHASSELYRSWDEAVAEASDRYGEVLENWKSGKYAKRRTPADSFYEIQGRLLDFKEKFWNHWNDRF